MPDIIERHLRRWAATDFVWGETDCSIVLADYVRDLTGRDGAAALRGRYASEADAWALGRRDGLAAIVGACAARAGLQPTTAPVRGDIGVFARGGLEFAGLCLGERWAVKSTEGLLFVSGASVIAAWSVERVAC